MFCGGFSPYGFGSSSIGLGGMFLSMTFNLIVFIGLIALAIKLFKNYPIKLNSTNATMRILDERFAKGEISEEDYLKRRTILSQKN